MSALILTTMCGKILFYCFEPSKNSCNNYKILHRVESPVLPPVLVPRFSDPIPGQPGPGVMPFHNMSDASMPHNVAYGLNGFNSPPMINTAGPSSPSMSSGFFIHSAPMIWNCSLQKLNFQFFCLQRRPTLTRFCTFTCSRVHATSCLFGNFMTFKRSVMLNY